MARISKDKWAMDLAIATSQRSTCKRRAVGCVLVDKDYNLLGEGYNGLPRGVAHCIDDNPCPGANSNSGSNLADCFAVHAEINALIKCTKPQEIYTVFVTTSPCDHCIGPLLNTSTKRIIFIEEYPHKNAKTRWTNSGRSWEQLSDQ